MPHTIQDFKSTLVCGGARPNLFEIEMTDSAAVTGIPADTLKMLCKAASLPASTTVSYTHLTLPTIYSV